MPSFRDVVDVIRNGETVDDSTTNRPLNQIQENARWLRDQLAALTAALSLSIETGTVTGTSADGYADGYAAGDDAAANCRVLGSLAIKNTHGTNSLDVKFTVTDAAGNAFTSGAATTLAPGAVTHLVFTDQVNGSRPPYRQAKVRVKSTSAGNPATFTVYRHSVVHNP